MSKELTDFIALQAEKLGYVVLEVALKGRSGLSVEITLDKNGGITLEECSEFNKMVSSWLDSSEASAKGYTVDVASPGLDRVLKSDLDFNWAVGKRVRVNASPVEGRGDVHEGELKSFSSGKAVISLGNGQETVIDKKDIVKAQLSPEI